MTDDSKGSLNPREAQAAGSSKEPSSGAAPSASDCSSVSRGIFRQVLLVWFADAGIKKAFRHTGRMLEEQMTKKSQATGKARHPISALDARLRAVAADLIFLRHFLQNSGSLRPHGPLDSQESSLARAAVQQGAQLLARGEALLPQYPPRPEAIATPRDSRTLHRLPRNRPLAPPRP